MPGRKPTVYPKADSVCCRCGKNRPPLTMFRRDWWCPVCLTADNDNSATEAVLNRRESAMGFLREVGVR